MIIDKKWVGYYRQLAQILGNIPFSFQKQEKEARLTVSIGRLGVPIQNLFNNPQKVTVCSEGEFCQLIGSPTDIIALIQEQKK